MSEPHEQLSEAMNARRRELRLQWGQLAAAARVSAEALRAIRRGDYRPGDLTALRLDEAFQWEPGSVERVLDGGDPVPLGQQGATPTVAAEAKAAAAEVDAGEKIDLNTYVPETPAERALMAIYRASEQDRRNHQRVIEERLEQLTEQINRLSVVREPDNVAPGYDGEHDRQQKGA